MEQYWTEEAGKFGKLIVVTSATLVVTGALLVDFKSLVVGSLWSEDEVDRVLGRDASNAMSSCETPGRVSPCHR